ncbi:MAG: prevent-host-death protein [bacterium]
MKTIASGQIKDNINKILEMVNKGEEIVIKNEQNQEKVAVIVSYKKFQHKRERPLGILKDVASCEIKDDFYITDEELLSL